MSQTPNQSNNILARAAIIFYHANCMDGFGAAYAFHQLAEPMYLGNVEYVPISYGDSPEAAHRSFIGHDVYILDFSFSKAILLGLCAYANQVYLFDHHKTAVELLGDWIEASEKRPSNLTLRFDMERSGAMITWETLNSKFHSGIQDFPKPSPGLLQYIEDRDLWRFKLNRSKEVNAVIAITDKDFYAYNTLSMDISYDIGGVVAAGKALVKQHENICAEIVRDASSRLFVGADGTAYEGLAANCTPQFSSEVGNQLAQLSETFGATYHITKEGKVKWSLRSIGDYDVTVIAKHFGGGGHRNAAGFTGELT